MPNVVVKHLNRITNICVSFDDIGAKIPGWIEDYNTMCPHERLGGATAVEFYEEWLNKLAKN